MEEKFCDPEQYLVWCEAHGYFLRKRYHGLGILCGVCIPCTGLIGAFCCVQLVTSAVPLILESLVLVICLIAMVAAAFGWSRLDRRARLFAWDVIAEGGCSSKDIHNLYANI